jgi:hypothetical protein
MERKAASDTIESRAKTARHESRAKKTRQERDQMNMTATARRARRTHARVPRPGTTGSLTWAGARPIAGLAGLDEDEGRNGGTFSAGE